MRRALAAGGNTGVEVRMMPDVGHGLYRNGRLEGHRATASHVRNLSERAPGSTDECHAALADTCGSHEPIEIDAAGDRGAAVVPAVPGRFLRAGCFGAGDQPPHQPSPDIEDAQRDLAR